MGQKVNPVGMRIGLNKNWNSRWYADKKEFPKYLADDLKIRNYIEERYGKDAQLSHIEIERKKNDKGIFVRLIIFAARPSIIIGAKGATVNALQAALAKMFDCTVKIDIVEVKQPYLDARIVADVICQQLEARASFRIVQKRAISQVRKSGAQGCKTAVSGRLAGADIARTEGYKEGTMAINTLHSDIDFATREAMTTYGKLGVKVWISRGVKDFSTRSDVVEIPNNRPNNVKKKGE